MICDNAMIGLFQNRMSIKFCNFQKALDEFSFHTPILPKDLKKKRDK